MGLKEPEPEPLTIPEQLRLGITENIQCTLIFIALFVILSVVYVKYFAIIQDSITSIFGSKPQRRRSARLAQKQRISYK